MPQEGTRKEKNECVCDTQAISIDSTLIFFFSLIGHQGPLFSSPAPPRPAQLTRSLSSAPAPARVAAVPVVLLRRWRLLLVVLLLVVLRRVVLRLLLGRWRLLLLGWWRLLLLVRGGAGRERGPDHVLADAPVVRGRVRPRLQAVLDELLGQEQRRFLRDALVVLPVGVGWAAR